MIIEKNAVVKEPIKISKLVKNMIKIIIPMNVLNLVHVLINKCNVIVKEINRYALLDNHYVWNVFIMVIVVIRNMDVKMEYVHNVFLILNVLLILKIMFVFLENVVNHFCKILAKI